MASSEVGPVYAFLPAHGDSRAGAVQEYLGHIWSEDFGLSVLLVDFDPRGFMDLKQGGFPRVSGNGRLDRRSGISPQGRRVEAHDLEVMLKQTRRRYGVVCIDLTQASPDCSVAVLLLAQSIFLVSDSDPASLEMSRDKARVFKSLGKEGRCGMLLRRTRDGLRPDLAEDFVAMPVCGLVDTPDQITLLARWLAPPPGVATRNESPEIDEPSNMPEADMPVAETA